MTENERIILEQTIRAQVLEEQRAKIREYRAAWDNVPKSLDLDELLANEEDDKKKRKLRERHEKWMKDKAQISIRIPIEFKAEIDSHVKARGEQLLSFVVRAIREQMNRDNEDM